MKRFKLLILSILLMIFFTGCSIIVALVSRFEAPPEGWAHDAHLERLMNHPEKELLTESEKRKASKAICEFQYIQNPIKERMSKYRGNKFCTLEKNDKIYFYDWCMECGSAIESFNTSYLLVRDGEPFENVQIETKYSKELGRHIPIIERLH